MLGGVVGLACSSPSIDVPGPPGRPAVTFEPVTTPGAVPPSVRARLSASAGAQPWLFRGELSQHYERELRQGQLASALQARAVPLSFWTEQTDLLLQPLAWLEPGEPYTLALLGAGAVDVWDVADDERARAEQFFPAPGRPVRTVSIQCSSAFEGEAPPVTLAPGHVPLDVTFDATRPLGTTCVKLTAERALEGPGVLPPSLLGVLLAPGAFQPEDHRAVSAPSSCSGVVELDSCIEVRDDRVLVTPLSRDTLWQVAEPTLRVVVSSAGRRTTLLNGLTPLTSYAVRGSLLTSDAVSQRFVLEVTTARAARHLILSEVLANPLGPEPASEWIELTNDSNQPVELGGLWLEDATSRSALPSELLAPRETALLVAAGFRPSALDVPIAPGTRLLTLQALGARGLSNSGEALLLVGPEGIVARFPALAAPHAGRSLARRALDGADDDPATFGEHGGAGASPGSPNRFD